MRRAAIPDGHRPCTLNWNYLSPILTTSKAHNGRSGNEARDQPDAFLCCSSPLLVDQELTTAASDTFSPPSNVLVDRSPPPLLHGDVREQPACPLGLLYGAELLEDLERGCKLALGAPRVAVHEYLGE
jgi:hypothetical protein